MDKSENFWRSLDRFTIIWTLLGIFVSASSGGGAVITYLNELPDWLPILLGACPSNSLDLVEGI